jgi:hypothetical protein
LWKKHNIVLEIYKEKKQWFFFKKEIIITEFFIKPTDYFFIGTVFLPTKEINGK